MNDQKTFGEIIRGHQATAPIDITALANDLGLNVFESYDMPEGISGKIARDPLDGGESGYSIAVNAFEGYRRRRFTVAHECAHFILHRDLIGDELTDDALYRSDKLPTRAEYEANNFAAELLMPKSLVLQIQRREQASAKTLADRFAVSERAMEIRLKYLSWSQ